MDSISIDSLLHIFSYLPPSDLYSIATTNKYFNTIASTTQNSEVYWRAHFLLQNKDFELYRKLEEFVTYKDYFASKIVAYTFTINSESPLIVCRCSKFVYILLAGKLFEASILCSHDSYVWLSWFISMFDDSQYDYDIDWSFERKVEYFHYELHHAKNFESMIKDIAERLLKRKRIDYLVGCNFDIILETNKYPRLVDLDLKQELVLEPVIDGEEWKYNLFYHDSPVKPNLFVLRRFSFEVKVFLEESLHRKIKNIKEEIDPMTYVAERSAWEAKMERKGKIHYGYSSRGVQKYYGYDSDNDEIEQKLTLREEMPFEEMNEIMRNETYREHSYDLDDLDDSDDLDDLDELDVE